MTIHPGVIACAMAIVVVFSSPAAARKFQLRTETIQLEKDILPGSQGSSPASLAIYNETLYFAARGDGQGRELWKYDDGTATRVSDISPGSGDAFPQELTVFDGALYFSAKDSPLNVELWRYDGTSTSLVAEIVPGSSGSYPKELTVFNGALYFTAHVESSPRLWRHDGAGTAPVPGTDQLREVQQLTVHDGQLWFLARNPNHSNARVWRTSGQGAQSVAPIDNSTLSLRPDLESTGSRLYAALKHPTYGMEIWRVTARGLSVTDIVPGPESSFPTKLTGFHGKLFMTARLYEPGFGDIFGYELVRFDGSKAELVHDINPLAYGDAFPSGMTGFFESLYFSADMIVGSESLPPGRELYKHNPDKNTTVLLKDIHASGSSNPAWFTRGPAETLYFAADDGVNGRELWSIRRSLGTLQVVLFPKWTPEELINPWEWEVQVTAEDLEADLAMAAFLLGGDGVAHFFQRLDLKLPRGEAHTKRVVTSRGTGKEKGDVTLAVMVFDRQSGDLIGIESASVAIGAGMDEKKKHDQGRYATDMLGKLTLRNIDELEPGSILPFGPMASPNSPD